MINFPIGKYKYEEIKERVDKIIIELDMELTKYKYKIEELKENHMCPDRFNCSVLSLIREIFSEEVSYCFSWYSYIEDTIKISIDSMLFCLKKKINSLNNDELKELLLNNIRFQLYHEKNPNFLLKCLIDRDLFTREEYEYIH